MNYGRGLPLPRYENGDLWIPVNGIQPDNGIGQSMSSWTAAMLDVESLGETQRRPILVDNGIDCGKESESWVRMGNGNVVRRDVYRTIHQVNGSSFVQNGETWNPVMPTNGYSRGNASSSWTPVTPAKPTIQRSNLVVRDNPVTHVENENWGDLVGMYKDLLSEEPLNLNNDAQNMYATNPPPMIQNRVVSTPNRNLNQIPYSTPVSTLNCGSIQAPPSVSYFPSEGPSNWDCSLLDAMVRPKKSSVSEPFINGSQNSSVYDLNRIPILNSSTQVRSNSGGTAHVGSMLGNQQHLLMDGYNSNQLPTDGFPVPYRPCYDLNSPPRSEHDATSSGITEPSPLAPITPDTRPKQIDNQWTPTKDGEDAINHYNIGDSTSSAVSTTLKEHLIVEEGDELGIDLNKTPNQKTPARRKKHRPKVIREGKAKKTTTPKEPKIVSNDTPVKRKYVRKSPQENGVEVSPKVGSTGKRKYVRKKVVDQSDNQQKTQEGAEVAEPVVETPVKSCRKQLNFDLEEIDLNDNPRDIEQEKRINSTLERSAMRVAQNSMYGGTAGTHDTTVPPTRDHALNVLARNLSMKNSVLGQSIFRNEYNQMGQNEPNGHMVNVDERRGVKRPSFEQINPRNLNATDSLQMYQELLLGDDNRSDRYNNLASIMEFPKKLKAQKNLQGDNLGGVINSLQMHQGVGDDNYADRYIDLASNMENKKKTKVQKDLQGDNSRDVNGNGSALSLQDYPSLLANGRRFVSPMAVTPEELKKRKMNPNISRSQKSTQGRGVNSVTAMVNWTRPPATPPKAYASSQVVPYTGTLGAKKRTMQNSSRQRSKGADKKMLELHKDGSEVQRISLTKPKGTPRKQKPAATVEDIICMLEDLCICDENDKARNALVPYKGNNAIIPFIPIKKRQPRPKVDLDPETDRLWRLLMGPEGSEANETLDKDKEKWWEDERQVFRGRADSFIARMHLVQGDRRFSRWKGSVVDSVIGVFLTQNVSDHLSSSAFMHLAAKFAFKSKSTNETRCQDGACVIVEEPIETVLPNEIMLPHDIIGRLQPVFNKGDSEVILSQDSLDSSTIQTIDEIRSSSGSNSEPEDQTTRFETSKHPGPPNSVQPERVSLFTELFSNSRVNNLNMTMGMQNAGPNGFDLFGGESVSSFHVPPQVRQYDFLSNHATNMNGNQPPLRRDTGGQKQDSCGENCVETVGAEANSKEKNYGSHDRLGGPDKNTPKGRKGNLEDEKKAFDWDSLRRDVYMKCEKTERSKDATDSLDYEALRRAHVSEISDAIRERGMNNLLADRIKDFLNRLVRDHGSIDLEWLRDAPPDKAKEYLLSIRGLGLKSVECVRLLTLHHLAFPVDTNVGRIAVRLGWVPLQPLPESLQLHLLEMYPVLESIQKYLWPRLCKLDQLTLYELHYQMITFGKVFCTKSKPNCNACPMRAECRHFASAFARYENFGNEIYTLVCISARLALPGPEEKRMVPSDASDATHIPPPPPVINRPMSLPPYENFNNDARLTCQPIIEEPTTPEPEPAELTISDIEDQYYEDDDEIPTIKLDMNEFTINLQKMQDSMQIQGDMSKALVALNPQAASIPTPKLKNVSRLRTEHLVYELPDSHPLLEGLFKREPDDPSPYLLAIWTPGETADSMQPPERGCQGQETGILCDRTTCFSCNCIREANSRVVRGTILMPCRTATRGSFPLNGTYFQVNEMFADHDSSLKPIEVPTAWIWNLPRRTVYFGTSVTTIFKGEKALAGQPNPFDSVVLYPICPTRIATSIPVYCIYLKFPYSSMLTNYDEILLLVGLTTQQIQQCFWRGFVCVRGFDQKSRSPRPLMARLHFPASKLVKNKNEDK
ncbi:transcriptional activator DEMETER-like protein isoform X1 [Tanacetum coccineum]|uniref:Transcriptional activator DEMETER-like protein isoform X1 n=1 Tax=Tanacetum coccineum TaxID=301880 RepID=A0ABQ5AL67_9ASTR